MKEIRIRIYLDKRKSRLNKDGKYPVTLELYKRGVIRNTYSLGIFLTNDDFKQAWTQKKTSSKAFDDYHDKIEEHYFTAKKIVKELNPFNLEDFKRLMFGTVSTEKNVNFYYSKRIDSSKTINTAKGYEAALNCLLRFHKNSNLEFKTVTINWLNRFKDYCLEEENKSITTVGIYLRTLRAVFNDAKSDKTIKEDQYPFGKNKFDIPNSDHKNRSLSKEQLKTLFEAEPLTEAQAKAKAFWFFSFSCNGMNFKDILLIKGKQLKGDSFEFVRAKTKSTSKNVRKIKVFLNDYSKSVIEQYGNINAKDNEYIFPVLNNKMSEVEQYNTLKSFTKTINKNFKKFAYCNGISEEVSTYWARHSMVTNLVNKGYSIEMVSEAVGHSDTKTTWQSYFAGSEDADKKNMNNKALDF